MRITEVFEGVEYAHRYYKWEPARRVRITSMERTIRRRGQSWSSPLALAAVAWHEERGWEALPDGIMPRELVSTWAEHVGERERSRRDAELQREATAEAGKLVRVEEDEGFFRVVIRGDEIVYEADGNFLGKAWASMESRKAANRAVGFLSNEILQSMRESSGSAA